MRLCSPKQNTKPETQALFKAQKETRIVETEIKSMLDMQT
jgi:hypothetical protein